MYMSAFLSSYEPLKFGILSFTAVLLYGVYCVGITLSWNLWMFQLIVFFM